MSRRREYPPAVRVHGVDCPAVKGLLLRRLPAREIAAQYPNGSPHLACLSASSQAGVIEVVDYPSHPYRASSQFPADATKALCAVCKGTHGVLDRLVLPPGVARPSPSAPHR